MARPREASNDQLAAFSHALRSLTSEGKRVRVIAEQTGVDRNAVYQWRDGSREPQRSQVFALEVVLGVPPGTLSRLLGYLPALTEVVGTEAAIMRDPMLSSDQRARLLDAYRAAVSLSAPGER